MRVKITISEDDIKRLICKEFAEKTGQDTLDQNFIVIEVKSRQNYKSEWEVADFRAIYEGDI